MGERFVPAAGAFGAGGKVISTPFQFLSTGEDNLRIEVWNSLSGVTVAVDGRWIQEGRGIDTFAHRVAVTADRARNVKDVALGAGYVLNLVVYAAAGSPRIGQTFVRISLIRGLGGATIVLGTLLQGYVTSVQGLGWPGSPIESSIAGGGVVRSIAGTKPTAGNEFAETVPTGARWELLRCFNNLTASATAATRRVRFEATTSGVVTNWTPAAGTQAANELAKYTWGPNLPFRQDGSTQDLSQPFAAPLILLAGDAFQSNTSALQAGDQWDNPEYVVREWLEVAA